MQHRIRDAERRSILQALEQANKRNWIKTASEIDYERNQIFIWLLIEGEQKLDEAVANAISTIRPFALNIRGPEFIIGFIEITGDIKIDWETVDDDRLRRGLLNRPGGRNPRRRSKPEYTVFDRPDYSIPQADEPA